MYYFHEKQKVYFHYPTRLELKTQPLCLIVLFLIHIDTNPLFFLYEDAISHKHNQNHLMIESNQKEAYLQYEKIIQKIKELNDGNLKDLNYGLWFIDMKFDDLETQYSNQMTEQNDDFILLLKKVDSYLRKNFEHYDKKEVLFNSHTSNSLDSLSITRTDLIASYYYYYNLMNTSEKTFNETFYDFKESIKSYLEQAHYQPISKKNIFDVLVILSAYSYQKM